MPGFSTYSDLQAALVDWLKDSTLSAQVDTFIALTEAYLNRELRVPEMEAFTTLTSDTGTAGLPGDFLQMKALWSGTGAPITQLDINDLQTRFGATESAPARAFALVGTTIYFGPAPSESTDYSLSYWQKIPTLLADAPTNWLISAYPDIYFYGSLLMAEARGWNDERLPVFQQAFDGAIASLKMAAIKRRYGAGPLIPVAPVGDFRGSGVGYRRAGYVESPLLGDGGDYLVDG